MGSVTARALGDEDRKWAEEQVNQQWGANMVVSKGKVHYPHQLPGYVAIEDGERVGLATYHFESGECELVTIHSLLEGRGVDSALLSGVRSAAKVAGAVGCG